MFFIDHNLAPGLARGMAAFGEEVTHLTDHFDKSAADLEWIPWIAKQGWFLISRDEDLRWKPAEKLALKQHKIGAFFMGGKELSRCRLVTQLVRNWSQVKKHSETYARPFVFRVPPSGKKLVRIEL